MLLILDGLQAAVSRRARQLAGGKPKVTDGPFAEAKECVGGYSMIQVKSKEEAVEWAKRAPMSHGETIEVRRCMRWKTSRRRSQAAAAGLEELQGRK